MGKLTPSAEAAQRLGVSLRRMQALCAARRVPGARLIGRNWMIPEDATITPGKRGPAIQTRGKA